MQELFERLADCAEDKVSEISLSYLEIYNETIRDLLVPGGSKQGLMLREDSHQAVSVTGLSSHHPHNVQEVMDMIVRGNEFRTMSPTEANATSSRSHAVLQINISQKERNADVNEPHTMATLSIIDLAGSERASATKNRGERLMEGANINKSLLALGSCINALCDPRKKNHVPYRNSKLTRLLKFSLGGNCKTVMIVCVSPSSAHFDETQNTLRYANRAKNIQTKVTRNVFNVNRHVKDYLVKIDEQMALISQMKQQQKDYESIAFAKFKKQAEKREAIAREGVARIRAAYENSSPERQERVGNMKRLRQIERRITLLASWMTAFDQVSDAQEDDSLLSGVSAMRKAAHGMSLEFERSRKHYREKIGRSNWARAVDSALQNGLRQLSEADCAVDGLDSANLIRETELLKANAEREALTAVAEDDKAHEAGVTEVLLKAHFETLAAVQSLVGMDGEQAMGMAKEILGRVIRSCTAATSHVVKPDSKMLPVEAFPPTKTGTPKRKRPTHLTQGTPLAVPEVSFLSQTSLLSHAPHIQPSPAKASPMRLTPKRRRLGGAKKGVSFTPKKKTPSKTKLGVRWRDATEEGGSLADFQKTPQKVESTPEASSSAEPLPASPPPPTTTLLPLEEEPPGEASGSSPVPAPPRSSIEVKPAARSDRFKSGFLAKRANGSPVPPTLSQPLTSSDTDVSPLRDLEPSMAGNRSSLRHSELPPADHTGHHSSGSDSDDSTNKRPAWRPSRAEAQEVRAAVRARASLAAPGAMPGAMRVQRRRSPGAAGNGSPSSSDGGGGGGGLLAAGAARRMMRGDKENGWKHSTGSPRVGLTSSRPFTKPAGRRSTMSGGHRIGEASGLERDGSARLSSVAAGSGGVRGSLGPGKGAWR